jgi:hypothetical protein
MHACRADARRDVARLVAEAISRGARSMLTAHSIRSDY